MTLELKHIVSYLPYGLTFDHFDAERETRSVCRFSSINEEEITISNSERDYDLRISDVKPILRPLSDLTKEINLFHSGQEISIINYLNIANSKTWKWKPRLKTLVIEDYGRGSVSYNMLSSGYLYLPFSIIQLLFENRFDVFGLIDSGLATDNNTLSKP